MRSNIQIMKLLVTLLILIFAVSGCKNNKLSPQYLTNVSVVRETEESNSVQKTSPVIPQTTTNINTPVQNSGFSPQENTPSSQYHIIVRSYGSSQYANAKEMVRKLKGQGYPAMLINKDKRFRVSIEHFNNKIDADNACEEYRKITENNDIWVLFLK